MPVPILQKDAESLRSISKDVPVGEIASERIRKVIANLKESMHAEDDAVAIAAPQIGESLRIFVMSGKARVLAKHLDEEKSNENFEADDTPVPPDEIYINPRIIKASRDKQPMEEGCLSVRFLYGKVIRSNKVLIEAFDENAKKIKCGGSGLIAQIYQHETDHLDGILFTDKAADLVELNEKERAQWRRRNRSASAPQ